MDESERSRSSSVPRRNIEILGGNFQRLRSGQMRDRAMALSVLGRNITKRGSPLLARVGTQPVLDLVIGPGSNSFSGLLASIPNDGDRLYVRYAGYGEIATPVVYRSSTPRRRPPVA